MHIPTCADPYCPNKAVVEAFERDNVKLRAEIDRLKRGDFTAEELRGLCHRLDMRGPASESRDYGPRTVPRRHRPGRPRVSSEKFVVSHAVRIDYTNCRGERSVLLVLPVRFWFGRNDWHPTPQWLMDASDLKEREGRTYALKDIHSWGPAAAGDVEEALKTWS